MLSAEIGRLMRRVSSLHALSVVDQLRSASKDLHNRLCWCWHMQAPFRTQAVNVKQWKFARFSQAGRRVRPSTARLLEARSVEESQLASPGQAMHLAYSEKPELRVRCIFEGQMCAPPPMMAT